MDKLVDIEIIDTKEKVNISVNYLTFKRFLDIVCSIFGLIILIPLIVIVKIVTLLSGDTNSIFYTQERIGKDGKIFKLYKFRSMVPDADRILFELLDSDKQLAREYKVNKKLKNDPRITKIGRILRKTSLDELPQILNILKGDMTAIGNRPYLPREMEDMGVYYDDIIKSRPGLSGIWQTAGTKKTTFEHRLHMEAWYSKNINFKLDIKIFFKTFKAIFTGHGAGI